MSANILKIFNTAVSYFKKCLGGGNAEGSDTDGEAFDSGEGLITAGQGGTGSYHVVDQQYVFVLQLFRMNGTESFFDIFVSLATMLHALFLCIAHTL